jgi:hypothetical protein
MAEPSPFAPVKLVCGIIASGDDFFRRSEEALQTLYGPVDLRSPVRAFDLTDYYESRMGGGLGRMFLSFSELIAPESLAEIKLRTNALEEEMRRASSFDRRVVNIDPGYITRAALIMATTKDFAHRVPLGHGIYAHLEFLFSKTGIRVLDWTYPDFRGGRYDDFFREARAVLLRQGNAPAPD